jgi:ATP synthase in type III secretion protein N
MAEPAGVLHGAGEWRTALAKAGAVLGARLSRATPRPRQAPVTECRGGVLRAALGGVSVGELCRILRRGEGCVGFAEIIGFDPEGAILMPYGSLEDLSASDAIVPLGAAPRVETGDATLGCIVDWRGAILRRHAGSPDAGTGRRRRLRAQGPDPLTRKAVEHVFTTGISAIDALNTVGVGQRIGIFGAAGLGKSTLVAQIVSSAADADVIVMGLVGERGREAQDFARQFDRLDLWERSVLVASTSDRPAVERINCALAALAIAEAHRDEGRSVLLVLDSLTRVARALRELGLARQEPPARRGFPASVFAELPKLIERAGPGASGAITAFFTVLAEGDVEGDPIVEEVRSLVDGHLILAPEVAASGRYPAIDLVASRSRIMGELVDRSHSEAARVIRSRLALYAKVELLLRVGDYKPGHDPEADAAIATYRAVQERFRQPLGEPRSFGDTVGIMMDIRDGASG